MTATLTAYLAQLPGRCPHGQHLELQGCADCTPVAPAPAGITSYEWGVFVAAVRQVAREDGEVHQCDMRRLIRGRIDPKAIGRCYRRAKSAGLLVDTKRREESDDVAGRNTDKLDRIYSLGRAA
jgi:hypothetical protein